jgi:Holliday junction resolvase-like predicted endonuclease
MTVAPDWPTAMLVLASEQLWPNIHGLAQWGHALRRLVVCHTSARQSAVPADRLAVLAPTVWPRTGTEPLAVHLAPLAGMQPQEVFAAVLGWLQNHPTERWLLNASGGTKLMHDGLLPFVGRDGVEIVYRELSGEWFRFGPGFAPGTAATQRITVPADATDRIPVDKLVQAQWQAPNTRIEFGPPSQPLDVLRLTREGVAAHWNWREAFRRAGDPSAEQSGFLFERYIAAALLALGVTNLACNVRRRALGAGVDQQEIDLVANHGGRLTILDCKLRTEEEEEEGLVESITSQIRQAAHTRRELGGLGASLVLLRPNRLFSGDERALAEACGLTVLDAGCAARLFTELGRLFGVPALPVGLAQAEAELAAAQARGEPPFERPQSIFASIAEASATRAIVDLNAYQASLGTQDWVAWLLDGTLFFRCGNPERLNEPLLSKRLRQLFGGFGSIHGLTLSPSGQVCRFILACRAAQRAALSQFLEQHLGRSILGATQPA